MTLQQLKDKATASELTLIEAVQAAVEENAFKTARHMVWVAASTYLERYPRPVEYQFKDWCIGLGKAIDSVSPKTDTP